MAACKVSGGGGNYWAWNAYAGRYEVWNQQTCRYEVVPQQPQYYGVPHAHWGPWGVPSQPEESPAPSAQLLGPEEFGNAGFLYAWVGDKAEMEAVAADLRNIAPTILIVCCQHGWMAAQMETLLRKPGIDRTAETRGDEGGRGKGNGGRRKPQRASVDNFQAQFATIKEATVIIAGRMSIVKDVTCLETRQSDGEGMMMIGEVDFKVAINGMLTVRVAAIDVWNSRRGSGVDPWGAITASCARKSVRVIAGEFASQLLQAVSRLRENLTVCPAALDTCQRREEKKAAFYLMSSAVFIVGPVGPVQRVEIDKDPYKWEAPVYVTRGGGIKLSEPASRAWGEVEYALESDIFRGAPENDESRHWNRISSVKQKEVKVKMKDSKKLFLFLGGKESRRKPESRGYRYAGAQARADENPGASGAHAFTRAK